MNANQIYKLIFERSARLTSDRMDATDPTARYELTLRIQELDDVLTEIMEATDREQQDQGDSEGDSKNL